MPQGQGSMTAFLCLTYCFHLGTNILRGERALGAWGAQSPPDPVQFSSDPGIAEWVSSPII